MSWGPPVTISVPSSHFATGQLEVAAYALPDPDIILRRIGKGVGALRELLIDPHLSSQWDVRLSAVNGFDLVLETADDTPAAAKARDMIAEMTTEWSWTDLAEKAANAVAYGYQPFELLWIKDGRHWAVDKIAAKPPEWFVIQQHEWKYRGRFGSPQSLPPGRFLFATHKATFDNPYGVKLFSKVYWPVTIKRNGLAWWTKWVERYGSAFLVGKHRANADPKEKTELMNALIELVNSAVATVPEDTDITTVESGHKFASSGAHKTFAEHLNNEVSKAIVGQSGTADLKDSGSYAALQVMNLVRQDIARGDRRRVCRFLNRAIRMIVTVNLGADVPAPVLRYQLPEDLQTDRVERDNKLFSLGGIKPTVQYLIDQYGFKAEHLVDLTSVQPRGLETPTHAEIPSVTVDEYEEDSSDHSRHNRGIFGVLRRFRSDRADKKRQSAKRRTLDDWQSDERYERQQWSIDQIVNHYLDGIDGAADFDDALRRVSDRINTAPVDRLADEMINARWVATNTGGHHA